MKVILHLTENCNLRCKYCYARGKSDISMSRETAMKAIDLGCQLGMEQGHGSACISYFGGEPLLKFDLLKELTHYAEDEARKHGIAMFFRLATNGTLFTEESLAYCRDHKILFALSIDGDQQAHDAQRVKPDGSGSFADLDKRLPMILRYNRHTVVTTVITPWNVARLEESIKYLWNRGVRLFVHALDFTNPEWDEENFRTLKDQYERLAVFYLHMTRLGEGFYMSLIDEKLKSHARAPFRVGENCDFGKTKLSVASDGRIFPCVQFISDRPDAANYLMGHVDTGLTERRQELIAYNASGRPDCEGCALFGRCANYCGCTNWQNTGDIRTPSALLCEHERMLIPIADEIGNMLWKEKNSTFLHKHYKYFTDTFGEYGID
jgi:uncharacterized protein